MAGKKTEATDVTEIVAPVQATDAFWVDPRTLKSGFNSRVKAEKGEKEQDVARAFDIYNNGQQQAIIVRQKDANTLEVSGGYGRLRSVLLIRDGFEYNGKRYQDAERLILCRVDNSIKSDKDAFLASIRENVRTEVSPLNKALAQEVLRKDFKMTEQEIAGVYQYNNSNAIKRNRDLLKCPEEVQQLVHEEELSLDAALKLMKLPAVRRNKLLTSGEKLTGAIIGEELNAYAEEQETRRASGGGGSEGGEGSSDGDPAPTKVKRNTAKFNKWVEIYIDRELDGEAIETLAPIAVSFVKKLVSYFNGGPGDQALWNAFEKLVDAEMAGK